MRNIKWILVIALLTCSVAFTRSAPKPRPDFPTTDEELDALIDNRIQAYIDANSSASTEGCKLVKRSSEGRAAFSNVIADDQIILSDHAIAGSQLVPIEAWDGEQGSLPNKIDQILAAINLSRTGTP